MRNIHWTECFTPWWLPGICLYFQMCEFVCVWHCKWTGLKISNMSVICPFHMCVRAETLFNDPSLRHLCRSGGFWRFSVKFLSLVSLTHRLTLSSVCNLTVIALTFCCHNTCYPFEAILTFACCQSGPNPAIYWEASRCCCTAGWGDQLLCWDFERCTAFNSKIK